MRMPALSHGVTSFLWALFFALYIWLCGLMVGLDMGASVVLAAVLGFGIFLYVRIYGEDPPRRA
jgi:hypothetical protein